MAIETITAYKQNNNNKQPHYGARAALGATAGAAVRYVLPKKQEMQKLNKDTFEKISSAALNRAKDRSILKYAGVGAFAAVAFGAISKAVSDHKQDNIPELLHIEYSKYGAFLDSSDCASELIWMA